MKPDHKYYDITELIQRWSEHGLTKKDLLKYGAEGKLQFSISLGPSTQENHIEVNQCFDEKTVVRTSDFSRKIAEDFGLSVDENEEKVVSRCCRTRTVSFENYELFDVTPLTILKLLASKENEVVALLTPDCDGCNRLTSTCDNMRVTARYVVIYDPNDMQNIRNPDDFLIRCSRSCLVVKHDEFLRFDELLRGKKNSNCPIDEGKNPATDISISKDKRLKWQDITITFLNDNEIHFQFGQDNVTRNYKDAGFVDGRGGRSGKMPITAWGILLKSSKNGGEIPWLAFQERRKVEKHVQVIRKIFRNLFPGIDPKTDPIPLDKKNQQYKTAFHLKPPPE
jgi:hypothetical protein